MNKEITQNDWFKLAVEFTKTLKDIQKDLKTIADQQKEIAKDIKNISDLQECKNNILVEHLCDIAKQVNNQQCYSSDTEDRLAEIDGSLMRIADLLDNSDEEESDD